jgi:hypothetical protein
MISAAALFWREKSSNGACCRSIARRSLLDKPQFSFLLIVQITVQSFFILRASSGCFSIYSLQSSFDALHQFLNKGPSHIRSYLAVRVDECAFIKHWFGGVQGG